MFVRLIIYEHHLDRNMKIIRRLVFILDLRLCAWQQIRPNSTGQRLGAKITNTAKIDWIGFNSHATTMVILGRPREYRGRRLRLLWFCTQNPLLCGQKWVLFNKNEFRLTKIITYHKNIFCHTKLSSLLSWQNSFLLTKLFFLSHKII